MNGFIVGSIALGNAGLLHETIRKPSEVGKVLLLAPKVAWMLLVAVFSTGLPAGTACSAAQDTGVQKFTLENGLTVLLRPSGKAPQTALMTLFRVGGDHDAEGKSGCAHLLEHLYVTAAAGTTPARTVDDYMRAYPEGWNAQTLPDGTLIATLFKPDRLEAELTDAAARMSRLKITGEDLEREVPRVLEELGNMYEGMPALVGINHARRHLHPQGGDGQHGGNPGHVRTLTVEELTKAWETLYRPNNATLVVVGNFDAGKIRGKIRELFGSIPRGKEPPRGGARPERGPDRLLKVKARPPGEAGDGVVLVAYAAPQPGQKDYPAFLVMSARHIFGAKVKPGMVPPVYVPFLEDPSTFALQASLPPGKDPQEVIRELEARLAAGLRPEVSAQDKMQALQVTALMGTLGIHEMMVENNPYGVALGLGRCLQLGIDAGKLRSQIEAVGPDAMKALAGGALDARSRVVVIVETQ